MRIHYKVIFPFMFGIWSESPVHSQGELLTLLENKRAQGCMVTFLCEGTPKFLWFSSTILLTLSEEACQRGSRKARGDCVLG